MACGLSGARLDVAKVPLIVVDVISLGGACELRRFALANGGGGEISFGKGFNGNRFGDFVGTMAVACGNRKGHLVGARLGVSVACGLSGACLPIAKSPLEARNRLSGRIGGGGAGELCGVALTNGSGIEVSRWLCVNHDFGGGTGSLGPHGGNAGVGASHVQCTVGSHWVLLRRGESVRACPSIGGPRLLVHGQVDGLAYAVRAIVAHNAGKNAAVGFSYAFRLGERNGTGLLGIVTNHQNVILAYFRYMVGDSTVSKG